MKRGGHFLRVRAVRSPAAVTALISSLLYEAAKWAKMANGHGDIRPTNILIQAGAHGPTAALIDPLVDAWTPLHPRTIPDRCSSDMRRLSRVSLLLETWLDSGEWEPFAEDSEVW